MKGWISCLGPRAANRFELCTVVEIPGVKWTEREVRQLVRKAVTEQGANLVDMRTESDLDCTYSLLEWRVAIPTCFQKDILSLAEGLGAQVILLLSARDLDEVCSQFGSIHPASVEVEVPTAGLTPASFYADMNKLVESLVKNSTISAHQGYRKLQSFSGQISTPS